MTSAYRAALARSENGAGRRPAPSLGAAEIALTLAARLEAVAPLLAHAAMPPGTLLALEQSLGAIETEMETLIALLCDFGTGEADAPLGGISL
jgi:hypothetical protein